MGKNYTLIFLAIVLIDGCGNDESTVKTSMKLTDLKAIVDGVEIVSIPVNDSEASLDGAVFTYTSNFLLQTGTWNLSNDSKYVSVEYESEIFEFPVISSSTDELLFIAKTLDLSSETNLEDKNLVLLLNQKLVSVGSSWDEVVSAGGNLDIVFIIKYE